MPSDRWFPWGDAMSMQDANIMREMAAEYRRQAGTTGDVDCQRRFAEWAAYCERMANAIEARLAAKR